MAASVGSDGGNGTTLHFTAGPGEINNLTISRSGATYTITDPNNLIYPNYGCTSASVPGSTQPDNSIVCHNPSFPDNLYLTVLVELGDMPDSLLLTADFGDPVIYGGDGDDSISWVPTDSGLAQYITKRSTFVSGGAGDDSIIMPASVDQIHGDDGNDTVKSGGSADTIYGGFGLDALTGENGADMIQGEGDADKIIGGRGKDSMSGGDGPDYMLGGYDADSMYGNAGNDTLQGGYGFDHLYGGLGHDICGVNPGGGAKRGCEA